MASFMQSHFVRIPVLAILWLGCGSQGWAQLSPDALTRLKAAAVYIENTTSKETSSGSGFVVKKHGDRAVIATNYHVVKPSGIRAKWKLGCTFHSGTSNQFELQAETLSVNHEDDLALLEVTGANLPEPITLDLTAQALETQRVYVAGFPFGQMLGVGGRKPSLTITEGSVSSVRRGSFNEPALIQLSGGVDPGNSGGPIIDSQGRLIAISVAKITQSSIGFGVPIWKLHELQRPVVRNTKATFAAESGTMGLRGDVNPIDGVTQGEMIHLVHVHAMKVDDGQSVSARFESQAWPLIEGLEDIGRVRSCGKSNDKRWLSTSDSLPIDKIPGTGEKYVLQWSTKVSEEETVYSRPYIVSKQQLLNPVVEMAENDTPKEGSSAVDAIANQQTIPTLDQVVVPFDSGIRRVIRAGGNRLLVVLEENGNLSCVDLATNQIAGRREGVNGDALASGKVEVVAFNRTLREVTRYRLPTLDKVGSRKLADDAVVRTAHRGSDSTGHVVAVVQRSGSQKLACLMVDSRTGRLLRLALDGEKRVRGQTPPTLFDSMPLSDGFRVRMSDDGETILMWLDGNTRVGTHVLTKMRSQWKYERLEKSQGYACPSPTGRLICTGQSVLGRDLAELHKTPVNLPTTSDDYFLTVGQVVKPSAGKPALFSWQIASASEASIHRTIVMSGDLTDRKVDSGDAGRLPIDERFQCLPQWNRLVVVPIDNERELRLIELGEPLPNVELYEASNGDETVSTDEPVASRVWKASAGSYQVEAKYAAQKSGMVKLVAKDGREIVVPIAKLCKDDQDYLERLAP